MPPLEPLARRERWFRSVLPNTRLCAVSWPLPASAAAPPPPPRGALLFVHGYAHYCAPLYDWLAAVLAPRGIACFALEHVGHGKSEGVRAFIPSHEGLVDDLLRFAAAVRAAELPAGTPLFAYGESLGAGLCILAALRAPRAFAGLVLLAPMVGASEGMEPAWPIVALGRAVALVAPTAALAPVREILPLCFRDASLLPAARADPNRYTGRMRLRTALELKAAIALLAATGPALAVPVFIAHGDGDQVTSHRASARLLEACASRDKTLCTFEGAWHVLFAEPADTRARLLEEITAWLDQRCRPVPEVGGAAAGGGDGGGEVHFRRVSYAASAAAFGTFVGEPGALTTVFSWASHAHLVTRQQPDGELAPADGDGDGAAAAAATRPAAIVALVPRLVALGAFAAGAVALSQGLFAFGIVAGIVFGAAALVARRSGAWR